MMTFAQSHYQAQNIDILKFVCLFVCLSRMLCIYLLIQKCLHKCPQTDKHRNKVLLKYSGRNNLHHSKSFIRPLIHNPSSSSPDRSVFVQGLTHNTQIWVWCRAWGCSEVWLAQPWFAVSACIINQPVRINREC